jgi:hypothetical protein
LTVNAPLVTGFYRSLARYNRIFRLPIQWECIHQSRYGSLETVSNQLSGCVFDPDSTAVLHSATPASPPFTPQIRPQPAVQAMQAGRATKGSYSVPSSTLGRSWASSCSIDIGGAPKAYQFINFGFGASEAGEGNGKTIEICSSGASPRSWCESAELARWVSEHGLCGTTMWRGFVAREWRCIFFAFVRYTVAGGEDDTVSAPDTNFLRYNSCLTYFIADTE